MSNNKETKEKAPKKVGLKEAKKNYKWKVIPIDELPDGVPVIAINQFPTKALAKFHLVEEVIIPVLDEEKQ
jgi:hypothetical protein